MLYPFENLNHFIANVYLYFKFILYLFKVLYSLASFYGYNLKHDVFSVYMSRKKFRLRCVFSSFFFFLFSFFFLNNEYTMNLYLNWNFISFLQVLVVFKHRKKKLKTNVWNMFSKNFHFHFALIVYQCSR